jgi:very-short-patch-repair endonuclease
MDERGAEVRAVRVGGRLTGISAVIAGGGWVLDAHPLHVSVPENASRLRTQLNRHKRLDVNAPRGVALHWDEPEVSERGTAVSVGLLDALVRVVIDEEFETAVAALDWALHTGALDVVDFETLIPRLPLELRGVRDWVDPDCESLPESLARTRLRLSGHVIRSQVRLDNGKRIDLVVDEIVGIEVDSDEFHRDYFERDRVKDVDMTIEHFHAMRPSARMVFHDWDRFASAVEIALEERRFTTGGVGNSGNRPRHPFAARGMTAWRRRPFRGTPEFPNGHGNTAAGSTGYLLRE